MNEEEIKKMIEETYNESKEDTLRSMIGHFYSRKMLSFAIMIWTYGLLFLAGMIFSGIMFFQTDQIQCQIMYAVIFLACTQFMCLIKTMAWQLINKNSIKREIKRLEVRIAQLNQTVQTKI